MRIGISVITHASQNIWSNGLGQNVIFLAQLLRQLPFVQTVLLIDCGDQGAMPAQVDLGRLGLRIMRTQEATDEVDVIIEMSGALDVQWLDLLRARGRKVVYHCCGHPYAALAENAIFGRPVPSLRPDRCDEIWLLPEFAALTSMLRLVHRCEVHEVPYLWHPQFIEGRCQEVATSGFSYGYKPRPVVPSGGRAGLRVAMFEPNISVTKSTTIPMLVCDVAHRSEPACIQHMHVLNTLHLKDHPTMLYLANSLDLVRQHHATFHGRHDIVGFMVQHADAVVAHQWTNEQNYSYLDALYGNYPLVHNSPWLRQAGYYYPDFDVAAGALALRRAASDHDSQLADYQARSQQVFRAVDPDASHNLEQYAQRLARLCAGTPFSVEGRV
jgi:hypothetical protein